MTVSFNADEVLALAEKIERHGAEFYRRAAETAREPRFREKLLELAAWEDAHEDLFGEMRRRLSAAERQPISPDPDDDTLLYLNAMAARHVLNQGRSVAEVLAGRETPAEVLEIAVAFERDSIALFQGLEVLVPEALGRSRIRELIEEEIRHVAHLERERERLRVT